MRNSQLADVKSFMPLIFQFAKIIPHASASTTTVLIAVASVESMFLIPYFAKIDVKAANTAERNANNFHIDSVYTEYSQ